LQQRWVIAAGSISLTTFRTPAELTGRYVGARGGLDIHVTQAEEGLKASVGIKDNRSVSKYC